MLLAANLPHKPIFAVGGVQPTANIKATRDSPFQMRHENQFPQARFERLQLQTMASWHLDKLIVLSINMSNKY